MTTWMTTNCWVRHVLRCTGGVHLLEHNVQTIADRNKITRADTITYSTWQWYLFYIIHFYLNVQWRCNFVVLSQVSQVPAGYSWANRPGTLQVVCEASGPTWCTVGPPSGWGDTRWVYPGSSGYSGVWRYASPWGSWTLLSLCLHPPVYLGMVHYR